MTLLEALQVFDEEPPAGQVLSSFWIAAAPAGKAYRVPYCCGRRVAINGEEIRCDSCDRRITNLGLQWVVSNWGARGIHFQGQRLERVVISALDQMEECLKQSRAALRLTLSGTRPKTDAQSPEVDI